MRDGDALAGQVDRLHLPAKEAHAAKHLADGIDDAMGFQLSAGDLVQHRRKKKVVVSVNQRNFDVRLARHRALEPLRRVNRGESAAEDQNAMPSVAPLQSLELPLVVRLMTSSRTHSTRQTWMPRAGRSY
jgi:hypothetical protein